MKGTEHDTARLHPEQSFLAAELRRGSTRWLATARCRYLIVKNSVARFALAKGLFMERA